MGTHLIGGQYGIQNLGRNFAAATGAVTVLGKRVLIKN